MIYGTDSGPPCAKCAGTIKTPAGRVRDALDRLGARRLWVQDDLPCKGSSVAAYAVGGRMLIMQDYGQSGVDCYRPLTETLSLDELIAAIEGFAKGDTDTPSPPGLLR